MKWPDGPRRLEHCRDLPGPPRLADYPTIRSLRFSPDRLPSRAFQGPPMRHRGVHVGSFHLVVKGGGEAFADEDEEPLVLFAGQAPGAGRDGAETVRAGEVALSVPDGPDGALAPVAVTRHDPAPLQEPERTPAELPGIGSPRSARRLPPSTPGSRRRW